MKILPTGAQHWRKSNFTPNVFTHSLMAMLFLAVVFMTSCSDESLDIIEDTTSTTTANQAEVINRSIDNASCDDRLQLAAALSKSMNNADVLNFVKEQANERQNGDNVFLFGLAASEPVNALGSTFASQILLNAPN